MILKYFYSYRYPENFYFEFTVVQNLSIGFTMESQE